MTRQELIDLVRSTATAEKIDADLFLAICTVESSLDPLAVRFEPAWRYHYHPREFASRLNISPETETNLQACSYGLAQVMGSVMRERGYSENLVKCFLDPSIPLVYAARHLRGFLIRYGTEPEAISAYNQGNARKTPGGLFQNQRYVDKVSQALRALRSV